MFLYIIHIITIILVTIGTCFIAASIRAGYKLHGNVPHELGRRWSVINGLMVFFLVGYVLFLISYGLSIATGFNLHTELLTGGIFFAGSVFVFLIVSLTRITVWQINASRREIGEKNAALLEKQNDLGIQIEEHKKLEDKLRESQAYFEGIFNSTIPLCIISQDHEILLANNAYYEIFGTPPEGEKVVRCFDHRPGPMCNTTQCPENIISEGDEEVAFETEKRMADGSLRYFFITAKPFRDAHGNLIGIVESFYDITQRKSAENSLAMEKERLAVTLQSIGDGVIATDIDGHILIMNRVAQSYTGWSPEEAIGLPLSAVFQIFHADTRKPMENPVKQVLFSGQIENLENIVLVAKDGWERLIDDSCAPIYDTRSEIHGVIIVFRDITEKKRIERAVSRVERLESLGVLAGGIAHDFNNVLTAITGNLGLAKILAGPGSEIGVRLTEAEKACKTATGLTQQLITFAKGGQPIKKTMSLDALLQDAANFVLSGSNVKCEFAIQQDLYPCEIDEGQISQVINNIIINADQAMPDGGRVKISAVNIGIDKSDDLLLPEGSYVKITIKDEGEGTSTENLGKIFDPYFTTKDNGNGLGLASCYSIIKKHSGEITVDSVVGEGTAFSIYLPASSKTPEKITEPAPSSLSGKGSILVMDDKQTVREAASDILSYLGYEVVLANEGSQAITLYREALSQGKRFDAVILDLTVPGGLGGERTIAQLREIDPRVKAIVSSGYSNDPIMAAYADYGFSGVILKPYNVDDMVKELQRIFAE